MSGEELVREIQALLKGLLKQGARLPKQLMLYVKNMIFFDGAITRLAPDLDIFAEFARIYTYFAEHHAEQISRDIGFDPRGMPLDLEGVKRSFGLENDVGSLTQRELLERREIIQKRLEGTGRR